MKIYQVEVKNKKFTGEADREITLVARNIREAIKKAQAHIESTKIEDFYGVKNWEIIGCNLITETI